MSPTRLEPRKQGKLEESYIRLIRNAYDLMLGTDASGHLTWVNPRVVEITEYPEDELIGKHYLLFIREDYQKRVRKFYGRQFAKKIPNTYFRLPIVTKSETELWLGLNVQAIVEKGKLVAFQAVARDVTGRQREEKTLRVALDEFRQLQAEIAALLEGSRAVLKYREFKDTVQALLKSCRSLLGASEGYVVLLPEIESTDEILMLDSNGLPHDAAHSSAKFIRKFCNEAHLGGRAVFENRPCTDLWTKLMPDTLTTLENILFSPLIIKGEPVGVISLINKTGGFSENDARMAAAFGELAALALYNSRTLESLEISEEFFRSVVQTASDAIVSSDSNGNIIFWNHGAEEIFGYSAEEAVGKPLTFVMPSRFHDAHQKGMDRVTSMGRGNKTGKKIDVIGLSKDGREFPLELSLATWMTRDGIFFTGISRDMTERKQAEQALRQAKKDAEIASRAKSEFLANMSHEIRTPMNAIIGMADLLWETRLTSEQQHYVRVFHSAGDTLLNLIDDILDLSKLEDGQQLKLEEIEFDPFDLLEKTCEIMALRAHEKGLELAYQVMSDVPSRLLGDPLRLRQILINLIGNAIKFTNKGEVIVRIAKGDPADQKALGKPRRNRPSTLLFSVADTGIGIPSEKIKGIFNSFAQADSSITREYGGTGLGLTISKRLVELMGGRIGVESQKARGSTFFFTVNLKAKTKREGRRTAAEVEALKGMRTLVLDDNATSRLILKEMLTSWGAEVTEIDTGTQALEKLKRARDSGEPYQLLLLDSRISGMGGFEVAERISNEPDLACTTIMMLTADHRRNDIKRCRELGISSSLVKPMKRASLLDAIINASGLLEGKDRLLEPSKVSVQKVAEEIPPLRILLVEDSTENCLLMKAFLAKTPSQIDIAENGQVAVEKFKSGEYDFVLMDMQMPIMDGYTATRIIRVWESENGKETVPIIALTAYAFEEDANRSIEAGCNFHLSKPIKKAVLLKTIHEYAHVSGSADK
jgi:PAS domain S-box-containing protein